MHRLAKVDGVEDLDAITFLHKRIADLKNRSSFGEDVVKIFRGNIFRIFASKIGGFNIIQHQTLHFVLQSVFYGLAEVNSYHIGGVLDLHTESACRGRLRCGQGLHSSFNQKQHLLFKNVGAFIVFVLCNPNVPYP